jgi:uncharacterized protein (TIGR02145 family)
VSISLVRFPTGGNSGLYISVFLINNNLPNNLKLIMKSKSLSITITCILIINASTAQIAGKDSSIYNTVKIGTQEWMTEDLNVSHFRNGDSIPEVESPDSWKVASEKGKPAWCFYQDNPIQGGNYHRLYNWYAVNDPRGLAPVGWRIPTDSEWEVIQTYLGGVNLAGDKMKSSSGWASNGNGTNESGFTGFPGGFRDDEGPFKEIGKCGFWWSSSESIPNNAWSRYLYYSSGEISTANTNKGSGYFVRCIKN